MSDALSSWNPWWDQGGVPRPLLGRPRRVTPLVVPQLDVPEVIVLTGVRRSGKSTIMVQLVHALLQRGEDPGRILFANLEDPGLQDLDLADFVKAFPSQQGRRFLFLDEVQERPGWERWVRVQYDQKVPLKVVVSGSSSDLTQDEAATLLTGRNLTHTVRPLDYPEFREFLHADDAQGQSLGESYLPRGGFPEAVLRDPTQARALLENYLRDIIHRDLVHRRALDPERIQRLAVYLARAFGGPHTKRRVASAVHLAPDTLRSYLEAMQSAFLIQLVPRFTESPRPSHETEAPFKVYWVDTGLRNAVVANPDRDRGTQAENVVANALGRTARPFYWTDGAGRHEVDFVVPRPDGRIDAYQVWFSDGDDPPGREVAALEAWAERTPAKRQGDRILLSGRLHGEQDGIRIVPLHQWLAPGNASA